MDRGVGTRSVKLSMAASASGAAQCKTIVLLTPEELDQAGKKPLTYSPPGR